MSGIRPQSFLACLVLISAFSGLVPSLAAAKTVPGLPGGSATPAPATAPASAERATDTLAQARKRDSLMAGLYAEEKALTYQTGEIKLGDGMAVARLSEGYRYLDPAQSQKVLVEMWGNPPGQKTLGMIFAPGMSPLKTESWAVIIQFDEDGYVKDDDAEKIDYDDLLKDIQQSMAQENKERVKQGYETIDMIGWAEKPHYDKAAHKLHWAKELHFGDSREHMLNYNFRVLGRKGVLILNAVSSMSQLGLVKEGMQPILSAVEFDEGHRYSEFDPKFDKVAKYGIAGLVAGGILAKVGFFKILIGFLLVGKKFLILGVIACVAFFRRFFKKPGERKEIEDVRKEMPDERKEITKE
jgi:uncharacterized membrane-anchored protein